MAKNIPSLISWNKLAENIVKREDLIKTAAKKEKDSDYDDKGNKKIVTDSGGREFGPRKGLEGPFKATSGHKGVYYYDPKEGKYYCPYTDMYLEEKPGSDTVKESSAIYDVICRDGSINKTLSVIANSASEAFSKAASMSDKYNINWNNSNVEVEASFEPWTEILKIARHRHEKMSLEAAVEKLVDSHLSKENSDLPEDEDSNKLSVYLGQVHVMLDVMERVTGNEVEREQLLNAIAKEAAKRNVDLEIGGHPEEAYLLLDKPMMEEMKTAAKKKKSKAGKNKPTNPSLWARAKAAAKAKFDVYPCVPLDSLAITKTGPQIYENLKIGDEILSYNIEKDELEWNSILNMHYFENAPMVQIGKATGFQVKCTPNHKWVVRRGENYQNTELIETKDLNKHMQLVVCASLENSSELVMEKWSKKDSWIEKILSMSKNEREIFLASAIIYDGHDKGVSTKILNRHSFGFSQKNEDHFYATILAAYLNGYHVTFADKYPDMQSATIIRNKKTHNTQNLIMKNVESEDVWCPETANGTWVMIQNGFLTITGNSAYANGWAVQWYKKRGGGWRKGKKK